MAARPEIESDRHLEVEVRAIKESLVQPRSKVPKSSISSAKSGELLTRRVNQIDLLEVPSLSTCTVERQARALRIGDES